MDNLTSHQQHSSFFSSFCFFLSHQTILLSRTLEKNKDKSREFKSAQAVLLKKHWELPFTAATTDLWSSERATPWLRQHTASVRQKFISQFSCIVSDHLIFTQQFEIHSICVLNKQLTAAWKKFYKQHGDAPCYVTSVKSHCHAPTRVSIPEEV